MPTLGDVWRAVFPAARSHGGSAGLDRGVGWVRVLKARVPAFDALDVEDLAILPDQALRGLAASGLEPAMVVDAVAAARGAAILVVGEDGTSAAARSTLERADAVGLPAFVVRDTDATGIERSVIGYIVNARAEVARQAARLEAELEQLALNDADLDMHAAAIGAFLGRAVAIEGPRGESLAVHAPPGLEGAAAAAAHYLTRPQRVALRTPLPVAASSATAGRRRPARAGSLAILGSSEPTELERTASERVAALLALELERAALRGTSQRDHAADDLPSDGPPWVVVMARQVSRDAEGVEDRESLRAAIRRMAPRRLLALRGDATSLELRVVIAVGPSDPLGLDLATRIAREAERVVAVSRPFEHREERPMAEAEARATLDVSGAAEAAGLVVRADHLPAYRLLAGLPLLPDGVRHARSLLAPILTGRPRTDAVRLATVRAIVDHPGLSGAAEALGVHRNTLAYRMRRIEVLTGWRMDDPSLRFALSLAVRLVQSDQSRVAGGISQGTPAERHGA